ncbi:hypothetical protein IWX47DRAFT_855646 [Phyllosticta citricarpa]
MSHVRGLSVNSKTTSATLLWRSLLALTGTNATPERRHRPEARLSQRKLFWKGPTTLLRTPTRTKKSRKLYRFFRARLPPTEEIRKNCAKLLQTRRYTLLTMIKSMLRIKLSLIWMPLGHTMLLSSKRLEPSLNLSNTARDRLRSSTAALHNRILDLSRIFHRLLPWTTTKKRFNRSSVILPRNLTATALRL